MKTVVGLFDQTSQAEKAARDLEAIGISRNDISVAANNSDNRYSTSGVTSDAAGTTAAAHVGNATSETLTGAAEGAGVGLLIGLTALLIPGLGWLAIGGWLGTTLVGAGVGAAVGLTGALTGVGVPHEEAEYYNEGVRRGGTLVAVKAPDEQAQRVAEILGDDGAINIDERADLYKQEGFLPTQASARPNPIAAVATAATAAVAGATHNVAAAVDNVTHPAPTNVNAQTTPLSVNANGETKLDVVEENLVVGKREVERGGVRIYQHVTETPVQEQVTLREEHVNVERHPVDRPVTAADNAFREGSIEMTERAEEAVVGKQARVVEEVTIGKQASERVETVSDTVRRPDVEVEQIPGSSYATTGVTGATSVGSTLGNVEHTARDAKQDVSDAAYRTESKIENAVGANGLPGVQTGGRNVDGSPDTRGITEKIADAVTGDRVDDKTGKAVA